MLSKCQLLILARRRDFRGFFDFFQPVFEYKTRARERAKASDRANQRENKIDNKIILRMYIVGGQVFQFFRFLFLDLWIKFGKIKEKV